MRGAGRPRQSLLGSHRRSLTVWESDSSDDSSEEEYSVAAAAAVEADDDDDEDDEDDDYYDDEHGGDGAAGRRRQRQLQRSWGGGRGGAAAAAAGVPRVSKVFDRRTDHLKACDGSHPFILIENVEGMDEADRQVSRVLFLFYQDRLWC